MSRFQIGIPGKPGSPASDVGLLGWKTSLRLALVGLLLCLFCQMALGGNLKGFDYRGGGQGPVTFDHRIHASRGYTCLDCHTRFPATGKQLFQTQKQGLISIADHGSDSKCFACHNDKVAFSSCNQCHRK